MKYSAIAALILSAVALHAQSDRASSDFEIARAQRELRSSTSSLDRIAAHLNLGDLHAARNEPGAARRAFTAAAAEAERLGGESRRASNIAQYARATTYAALAAAKLGQRAESVALFDESVRYIGDSASAWNLYASGMQTLRERGHAAAVARNAVAIAEADYAGAPSRANLLDLNIYRYTLASALAPSEEAVELLEVVIAALESSAFDNTREEVAREEEFEILSTVRRDSSAYVTLLARARLRLAAVHEGRGEPDLARKQYEKTIEQRSDEPIALAGLARLEQSTAERRQFLVEALDADPFSPELVARYIAAIRAGETFPSSQTIGGRVRAALEAIERGRHADASRLVAALRASHPDNETIAAIALLAARARGDAASADSLDQSIRSARVRQALIPPGVASADIARLLPAGRRVTLSDADLQLIVQRLRQNQLTSEERRAVDAATLQQIVRPEQPSLDDSSIAFERGVIGAVPFRFVTPMRFSGDFSGVTELQLSFRVLGWSDDDRGGALLLEPLGVAR